MFEKWLHIFKTINSHHILKFLYSKFIRVVLLNFVCIRMETNDWIPKINNWLRHKTLEGIGAYGSQERKGEMTKYTKPRWKKTHPHNMRPIFPPALLPAPFTFVRRARWNSHWWRIVWGGLWCAWSCPNIIFSSKIKAELIIPKQFLERVF